MLQRAIGQKIHPVFAKINRYILLEPHSVEELHR